MHSRLISKEQEHSDKLEDLCTCTHKRHTLCYVGMLGMCIKCKSVFNHTFHTTLPIYTLDLRTSWQSLFLCMNALSFDYHMTVM